MRFLSPEPKGYPRRSSIAGVCQGLIYDKPWKRENWAFDKEADKANKRANRQADKSAGSRNLDIYKDLI